MATITDILDAIRQAGGTPLFVGGCVRDGILGLQCKDTDIEVYNLDQIGLVSALSKFGPVDMVGASFGVFKVHGLDVDISLPRRDSKVGAGHRGFDVQVDGTLTIEEAASRRDFTINALAQDPANGEIIDLFGGVSDLQAGILRHTGPAFADDPLRVLRGFQFAGRFGMTMAPETVSLCQTLAGEFSALATERVWGEWWKWATKSVRPSMGLDVLVQTGWVSLWPALAGIVDLPQDSEWHPEGGVWEHTRQAVDVAARIATGIAGFSADDRALLVFSALLHDVGKATTTATREDGRIVSPGHDRESARLAGEFLASIGAPAEFIQAVCALVGEHMAHINTLTRRSVAGIVRRLGGTSVAMLVHLMTVDHSARAPLAGGTPAGALALLTMAEEVGAQAGIPAPILMGRHLLAMGWVPGPEMGTVLRAAHAAQLEGEFHTLDGAHAWLENQAG